MPGRAATALIRRRGKPLRFTATRRELGGGSRAAPGARLERRARRGGGGGRHHRWFAILFTGRYPDGLWNLAAFYLRWRVRAVAYTALLRDEYPPFGEGDYPASLDLNPPVGERDRLTVAFRIVLAIPHILAVWVLGIAWALTTLIAWFAILFTGRYPEGLYGFAVGVLRWNIRVEAYLLLLHDEYPPFSLE